MVFVISSLFLQILVTSLSIRTEKGMYFLVLLAKQVNCPSVSSASSSLFAVIYLSTLYFKLHVLCATPLYSTV